MPRLSIWISPRDLTQLVRIGLEHPDVRYEIVYGVSNNQRSWYDNSNAYRLGYKPEDNAHRVDRPTPVAQTHDAVAHSRQAGSDRTFTFHLTGEARQTETWDGKLSGKTALGHRLDRWGRSAGRPGQTISQAQLGWFRGNSALPSPDQRLTKAE